MAAALVCMGVIGCFVRWLSLADPPLRCIKWQGTVFESLYGWSILRATLQGAGLAARRVCLIRRLDGLLASLRDAALFGLIPAVLPRSTRP